MNIYKMSRRALVLISFFYIVVVKAADVDYGLKFNSYKVLAKDRTGLLLENNKTVHVGNSLTIDFDFELRKETMYGSILRVVNDAGYSIILNLGINSKGQPVPVILINNQIRLINNTFAFDQWTNIKLTISDNTHEIQYKSGNFIQSFPGIKNEWNNVRINFGVSKIQGFITEEVPPISLRNVKLLHQNNLFRHWQLGRHNGDLCYDEIDGVPALAYKPEWLIDSHTEWLKKLSLTFNSSNYTQYAYDTERNIIYIVPNEKEIIAYYPETGAQVKIPILGGSIASRNTNQLVFDTENDQLISYNLEEKFISVFSFSTNRWSNNRLSTEETKYWHHTADFWAKGHSVFAFGGYGIYEYKNDLFNFTVPDGSWKTTKLKDIPKRYSAASLILNDTLFIFSGEGNESGKQEVPTRIFSDLYSIDLKTLKVSLVWKSSNSTVFGLPCGNMVYNSQENCFYALTNKDGCSIIKINKSKPVIDFLINNGKQEHEADFNFHTLMRPAHLNKLYSFFCRDYKLGSSKIDIYETAYPPLSKMETIQPEPRKFNFLYLIIAFAIAGLGAGLYLIFKRKKKTTIVHQHKALIVNEDELEGEDILATWASEKPTFNRSRKSISLLGTFNVRDKDGTDITNQFAPTLKTIILMMIMEGGYECNGVSSNVIDSTLWPDKDKKSTRNNRNVSINRLNNVLENVGGVRIYNDGSLWRLEISDDTFCDYFAVNRFMKTPLKELVNNKIHTAPLLELLSYGQLLQFTQIEWVDSYKAAYSNFALDFLGSLLEKDEVKKDIRMSYRISEIISLFDSINENALHIKCRILYSVGKKGLAKFNYDNFCKEYETLLGEKYQIPFIELIDPSKTSAHEL